MRNKPASLPILIPVLCAAAMVAGLCGYILFAGRSSSPKAQTENLRKQQIARLQFFSGEKEGQATELARASNEKISREYQAFFKAARNGNTREVERIFQRLQQHQAQAKHKDDFLPPRPSYWQPVLEVYLAYQHVGAGEPAYTKMAVDEIMTSIPPGSICFAGTEPTRGLLTAFSSSQIRGEPFFTLSQTVLSDENYLRYLRATYGAKINIPSAEHARRFFEDFWLNNKKFPVRTEAANMAFNGLFVKYIFDENSGKEFYYEASVPLDWVYPYLSPHGFILKINREPLPEITEEMVTRDHRFWQTRLDSIVGDWLTEDTPVITVVEFVEKVYARRDFSGLKGDTAFFRNERTQKMFSNWLGSIARLYSWRIPNAKSPAEQKRMAQAADLAFRQAFTLCPSNLETVYGYINFLLTLGRVDDSLLIAEAARKVTPEQEQLISVLAHLKRMKAQQIQAPKASKAL